MTIKPVLAEECERLFLLLALCPASLAPRPARVDMQALSEVRGLQVQSLSLRPFSPRPRVEEQVLPLSSEQRTGGSWPVAGAWNSSH